MGPTLYESGSVKETGFSRSSLFAEANESSDPVLVRLEMLSSESDVSMSRGGASRSDSDPEVPSMSLLIAVLAVSRNHSSSGRALKI